jgi:hypothetical protein
VLVLSQGTKPPEELAVETEEVEEVLAVSATVALLVEVELAEVEVAGVRVVAEVEVLDLVDVIVDVEVGIKNPEPPITSVE